MEKIINKRRLIVFVLTVFMIFACLGAFAIGNYSYKVSADTTAQFYIEGASVKCMKESDKLNNGLRFELAMTPSQYNDLAKAESEMWKDGVEVGMLLVPEIMLNGTLDLNNELVGKANEVEKDKPIINTTLDREKFLPNNAQNPTKYKAWVAIENYPAIYHSLEIMAVGYYKVGTENPVYTEICSRSMAQVAYYYKDTTETDPITGEKHSDWLIPYYDDEKMTVNFELEGETVEPQSVQIGSFATVPNVVVDGYMVKWYDKADANKTAWDFSSDKVVKNITLKGEKIKITALDAQFIEEPTLTVNVEVETLSIDGNAVEFTKTGDTLSLSDYTTKGRATAQITTQDGAVYTLPFVYADVVIDSVEDVQNWQTKVTEGGAEYVVLAKDIDCAGAEYTATLNSFAGTFDGYNHEISGLKINVASLNPGWGNNQIVAIFLSCYFTGTLQDLALTGVSYNSTINYSKVGVGYYITVATIKNCYISGKVAGTHTSGVEAYLLAKTVGDCTLQNNIFAELDGGNVDEKVIDSFTALKDAAKTSNNLLITNDTKFKATAGFTCVTPANLTADNLKTFATNAGGAWSYNEAKGLLKLGNTVVYVIPQTLAPQFIEEPTLTVNGEVETLSVDGNAVEFMQEGTAVALTNYTTKGRATAQITTQDGAVYTLPFVYADVVIRDVEDVQNWQTKVSEQGTEYVVLAKDIACNGAAYKAVRNDFRGTFDGYNHEISGLNINYNTLTVVGSSRNVANFLSGSFSGTLQDLALTDVTYNPAGGYNKAGLAFYMNGATIKNCYVSARVNSTPVSNEAYLLAQTVTGCVLQNNVIVELDGGNSTEQIVPAYTPNADAAKTSNNLLITNDTKFTATAGFTCVTPANLTADNLKTFAETAGGDWVYDETTGELKLGSTVVYSSNANN